ncbi:MAG: MopE-related protein, partial [Chitinophagales bacterium]
MNNITPKIHFAITIVVFIVISTFTTKLSAQEPVVQWDQTIGTTSNDNLVQVNLTSDGGFILGGYTSGGISGDKTEANMGGTDMWVVKLDALGNIQWQNSIGTSSSDNLVDIVQTVDGGFLLGCTSSTGISGDKTEAAIGLSDFWIIKLNASGVIMWQNTIGGTGNDNLTDIEPVPSGGFLLSGYSSSGISGDKTEANIGLYDYWIVKINPFGTIQWQHTIGGDNNDKLLQTVKSNSGNYVLAGQSVSGISGNKTEAQIGTEDYWLVEIDIDGNIIWQNTIGGPGYDVFESICVIENGGYLIGGTSSSNIGGDKTALSFNHIRYSEVYDGYEVEETNDMWVIKLDSVGNVIWDKTFGSQNEEQLGNIVQANDNRFWIIGESGSGSYTSGFAYSTYAIDSNGLIIWSDLLNGDVVYDMYGDSYPLNGFSNICNGVNTLDGGFFIGGYSDAEIGGDKSEGAIGGEDDDDFWVIKLAPDTCAETLYYLDYDLDDNGGDIFVSGCELPGYDFVTNTGDCDDLNSNVYLSATEICDGIDNNCDGSIDEGLIDCNSGPSIFNSYTVGTNAIDEVNMGTALADGNMLLAGRVDINEDLVGYYGVPDATVTKLSGAGEVIWTKIFGGTSSDFGVNSIQGVDGGYIHLINSYSNISGNKTVASFGSQDLWVVKTNDVGDIEWQKVYGGSLTDVGVQIVATDDSCYIIGAHSNSGITGNKTENTFGFYDFWIIKIDADGNIIWQNTIGGGAYDYLYSLAITNDGGVILGGNSNSEISGEKTALHYGLGDYWLVKLDSVGEIDWQKTRGGTGTDVMTNIVQTPDNGFVALGYSTSTPSIQKSETSYLQDLWVVKMNESGAIVWENTIQASANEISNGLAINAAGEIIIGAWSNADIGYDKNEPTQNQSYVEYVYNNFAQGSGYDFWVLNLSPDGNINWQNTIGGNMDDNLTDVVLLADGKVALVGTSSSFISADKQQNQIGGLGEVIISFPDYWFFEPVEYADIDMWVVLLNGEDCELLAELCNGLDDNCNGLTDDGVIESITLNTGDPTTFCQGGSATLSATHTGTSLQWKKNGATIPGATGESYVATTKGNYSCVTTSVCASMESTPIFVNVIKNPNAIITAAGATTFCVGGSVVLNANAGAGLSYQWYKNGIEMPGATTISYTATTAGIYKCKVIKTASGCFKMSNGITVTVPCKEGEMLNGSLSVYPNPATNNVQIEIIQIIQEQATLQIINTIGQIVYSTTIATNQTAI